jgi:hypothetical protein
VRRPSVEVDGACLGVDIENPVLRENIRRQEQQRRQRNDWLAIFIIFSPVI